MSKILDREMKCLYLLFVLLVALDLATTAYALSKGYSEANPLVLYLMNKMSLLGLSILRAVLSLVVGIALFCLDIAKLNEKESRTVRRVASVFLILSIIALSIVVFNNFYQLLVY